MRDRTTGAPLFTVLAVELACAACKAGGKPEECVHMLHLVPRWQSADRHQKLKVITRHNFPYADLPAFIDSIKTNVCVRR